MLKTKLPLVVSVACLLGGVVSPAFAAIEETDKDALIQKISQRTESLENEVKLLKQELKRLKYQRRQVQKKAATMAAVEQPAVSANLATPSPVAYNEDSIPFVSPQLPKLPGLLYLGGTPVTASPYVGVRSEYDASDLIVNLPAVNEDLRLQQQWEVLEQEFKKYNQPVPDRPFISLSGKVETQFIATKPYAGRSSTDIDVSGAELDAVAWVNSWALAYLSLKFDNSLTTPPRTSNSNVFVDDAFISVGELHTFPIYATVGQSHIPFGLYSTSMVSAPLTQSLARTKARYFALGYSNPTPEGLYGSIYTFRGESATATPSDRINQGGINIGYKYHNDQIVAHAGGGLIANIADSEGMQANGGSDAGFTGFGASSANEELAHLVPAADVHASVGCGPFRVGAEYITALRDFDAGDMTFNDQGARPQALSIEGSYSFQAYQKPSSFAIGYQQTKEALALLLPEHRLLATVNTSIWKATIASLEFRHDINYDEGDFATGQGVAVATSGLGETSEMITAQFGVYF